VLLLVFLCTGVFFLKVQFSCRAHDCSFFDALIACLL
jgi:hypothetical protein